MPLLVLSGDEAIKRVRHVDSRWPRTADAQAERLLPLAQPRFYPSFKIARNEMIFTIGSCFARNIEKQLLVEGYDVAVSRFEPPADVGFKADSDALLNRYVVTSIANELKWAFGQGKPFNRRAYVHVGQDRWFDPHLHPLVTPASLEVVEARRAAISRYMALAREARVFIMTLGLAEAWYDNRCRYYLNGVLPTRARELHRDRFELHLLDYNQILEQLEFIHFLLARFGRPDFKMLVTVSPVAMNTTFTGGEVLTANTYSKAVQRAAVEAFVRRHDNVDYFPSYESVMLSDRRRAWRDDQAHVSDELVRMNVLRMTEAYGDDSEDGGQASRAAASAFALVQRAREAAELDAPDEAIAAYEAAVEAAPNEALILLEFGRFLAEQHNFAQAAALLEASTREGSGPYGGYYHLARAYGAIKLLTKAHEAIAKAREFQPNRPAVVDFSANIARKLDLLDEAIVFAEAHLKLEPDSEPSKARLEALRAQLAARPAPAERLKELLAAGAEGARRRRSRG
jgi:tetratricopeptide (TPR) repeat protein